jgi:hypothetical protein
VRRPKKLTTTLQPNGNIKKKQMMEFQRDWGRVNGENTPICFSQICSH